MSWEAVLSGMQQAIAEEARRKERAAVMAKMTPQEVQAFEVAEKMAEIDRKNAETIAYLQRIVDDGRAIYAARLALGDFEPKREQTFWQWLIGKKPQ